MSQRANLARRFLPLASEAPPGFQALPGLGLPQLAEPTQWSTVLVEPRVVVVGEAGAGKSTEVRAKARELAHAGVFAFYAQTDAVARSGLRAALVEQDRTRFEEWLTTPSAPAQFFLDSSDGAGQVDTNLPEALTRLEQIVGDRPAQTRVLVTCRATSWASVTPSGGPSDPSGNKWSFTTYRLAPLTEGEVERLVAHLGVSAPHEFFRAVAAASAGPLIEQPADVKWLVGLWQSTGGIGELQDILERYVEEKIMGGLGTLTRSIDPATARNAVKYLASTATLASAELFHAPSQNSERASDARSVDTSQILEGWTNENLSDLFSLDLFAGSLGGAFSFRSELLRDYLSASWLRELLTQGLAPITLRPALFCEGSNDATVRPHLHATVGWLCLWSPELRNHILRVAPDLLLREGDPSGLSSEDRKRVLLAYARGFDERTRLFHSFDRAKLGRFATSELAVTINQLLSREQPGELSAFLLRLVEEGELTRCVDIALEYATAADSSVRARYAAIGAVGVVGTSHHKRSLLEWVGDEASLDPEVAAAILRALYPADCDINCVLAVFRKTIPSGRSTFDTLDYFLEYELTERTPLEEREHLLGRILEWITEPPHDVDGVLHPSRGWLLRAVAALSAPLLETQAVDPPHAGVVSVALDLVRQLERAGADTLGAAGKIRFSVAQSAEARRALFWNAAERRRTRNRSPTRVWHLAGEYRLFELQPDDIEWLAYDVRTRAAIQDQLLAFDAIAQIPVAQDGAAERAELLVKLAASSPPLARRLSRMANPPSRSSSSDAQFERRERARRLRTERLVAANKAALTAVLEKVADGTHMQGLRFLYREAGHRSDSWSALSLTRVEERYGHEVARAFGSGLKKFWRTHTPLLPHERDSRNVVSELDLLGLSGATLEIDDGLLDTQPSVSDAERLTRYASCELNGFAPWLSDLATMAAEAVRDTLAPAIFAEFRSEDKGRSPPEVLAKLASADAIVRVTCLEPLLNALRRGRAALDGALRLCLEAVLAPQERAPETFQLPFHARCDELVSSEDRFALWCSAWLVSDPRGAVDYLETLEQRSSLAAADFGRLVEAVCHRIYEWSEPYSPVRMNLREDVESLKRLTRLVLWHIGPDSAAVEDGLFTPGRLHHAQIMRGRLVALLANTEGETSEDALRSLARDPRLAAQRDWLLHLATQRGMSNDPCAALALSEAIQTQRSLVEALTRETRTAAAARTELAQVQRVVGNRYKLLAKLGDVAYLSGLFRAFDTRQSRHVLMRYFGSGPGAEPSSVEDFERGVAQLRKFSHAGLADVVDYSASPAFAVFSEPDGVPLSSILQTPGSAPALEPTGFARELAHTLAYLHKLGQPHGELSSQTVFAASNGRAVLIPGFSAPPLATEAKLLADYANTPWWRYRAPEARKGAPASVRQDLFAFGVLMLELFARRPIEPGQAATESAEPDAPIFPRLQHLRPSSAPWVDELISRLVHPNPDERPANMGTVLDAFEVGALSDPVRASENVRDLLAQAATTSPAGVMQEFHRLWNNLPASEAQLVSGPLGTALGATVEKELQPHQGVTGYILSAPSLWIKQTRFPLLFARHDHRGGPTLDSLVRQIRQSRIPDYFAVVLAYSEGERRPGTVNELRAKVSQSPYSGDIAILSQVDVAEIVRRQTPRALTSALLKRGISMSRLSPYVTRGPVSDSMFFGRKDEIRRVTHAVESGSVAIVGGRRMGKTSTLLRLGDVLPEATGCAVVHMNCEDKFTQADFYAGMTTALSTTIDGPHSFRAAVAKKVKSGHIQRVVFLLDEVDELVTDDSAGQPSWKLFKTLRVLSQEQTASFVFAGGRTLARALHAPDSPLFNFCDELVLRPLDERSVAEIVRVPMEQLGVRFSDEDAVVSEVIEASSCHPNIVQFLCQEVLERATLGQIDLAAIREIIASSTYADHFLETAWGDARPLEKLLTILPDETTFSIEWLEEELERIGIGDAEAIRTAVQTLELYSMFQSTDGQLEFTLSSFPSVVRRTDIHHLRKELTRRARS